MLSIVLRLRASLKGATIMFGERPFVRNPTFKLLLAAGFAVALTGAAFAWGSVAVDDSYEDDDIGFGYSTGHDTEAAASAAALEECKNSDNAHCKVVLRFKTCGALAGLKRKFGVGEGSTKKQAEDLATKACGQSACAILVSECEEN
jgi:hypothetical protein